MSGYNIESKDIELHKAIDSNGYIIVVNANKAIVNLDALDRNFTEVEFVCNIKDPLIFEPNQKPEVKINIEHLKEIKLNLTWNIQIGNLSVDKVYPLIHIRVSYK